MGRKAEDTPIPTTTEEHQLAGLTARQREILHLVQSGRSNKEVARELGIAVGTVKQHLVAIYRQLQVDNRTKASRVATRQGEGSLFGTAGVGDPLPSPVSPASPVSALAYSAGLRPVSLLRVRAEITTGALHRLGSARFHQWQQELGGMVEGSARRHGGVAQGVPGGYLVLFGVPHVREDDPERAVCCGCEIRAELQAREGEWAEGLVGLGVSTGGVVTTTTGEGRISLHGELLTAPTPPSGGSLSAEGGVGICPATREALARLGRRYGPLPPVMPGGACCGEVAGGPGVGGGGGEPPLVGREVELAALQERFRKVRAGESRALLILGEAGFGKSRLVGAWRQGMGRVRSLSWLVGGARAVARGVPLHPFLPVVEGLAGVAAATPLEGRREGVARWLAGLPAPLAAAGGRVLPLLYPVAGGGEAGGDAVADGEELLAGVLLGEEGCTVVFLDNLQWADPASRRLFVRLAGRLEGSRVWLVGAGRRAELRQLTTAPEVDVLALRRLTGKRLHQLIKSQPGGKGLGKEGIARLARWSGGVPLFAVEITRHLLAGGDRTMGAREALLPPLPPGLAGLVLERLEGAGVAWPVLRALAAHAPVGLGRLGELGLPLGGEAIGVAVEHLLKVGLVVGSGYGSRQEFSFVNPVVHSAVWHTLPEADRGGPGPESV